MEEYFSDILGGDSLFTDPEANSSAQEGDSGESLAGRDLPLTPSSSSEVSEASSSSEASQGSDHESKHESRATWPELSPNVSQAKSTQATSLALDEKPAPVIPKPAPLTVSIPKPAVETKVELAEPNTRLDEKLASKLKQETQLKTASVTKQSKATSVHEATQQIVAPNAEAKTPKAERSWTERDVDCLLFKVNGLTLAVPLEMLGSVHKLKEEITPLFGSAPWFLGIFMVGEEKLNLLDTTQWVMPERYTPNAVDSYRFAIRLGKSNWAVACDEIGQAIKVTPTQVKWRTERGKRSWLAGTVIEHMCGLLDAENLLSEMEREFKKRRLS